MGKYEESARAFIEALKLNPSDKDAKHNLELALGKMKEQQSDRSKDNRDPSDKDKEKSAENKGNKPEQNQSEKKNPSGQEKTQQDRNQPEKMQPEQSGRREGSISREQAERILDAVQNQELEDQRRLLESKARLETGGKDW